MRAGAILMLAGAGLLLPAVAQAQTFRTFRKMGDFSANLAYAYCPSLLDGKIAIDGAELKSIGFTETPLKQVDARFGETTTLQQKRDDGEITLTTDAGRAYCAVTVTGATDPEIVSLSLRSGLTLLNYKFEKDPANSYQRDGFTVDAWKSVVKPGEVLHLRFAWNSFSAPKTVASFQMIWLDQ